MKGQHPKIFHVNDVTNPVVLSIAYCKQGKIMEKAEQSFLFSRDITVQVGTGRDKSHAQNCFGIPEEEPFTSSLCARRMSQNNKLAIIIVKGLSWLGLGKNL